MNYFQNHPSAVTILKFIPSEINMNYTDNEFSFNLVSRCDIKTHTKSVTEKSTDGPERDVKKEEDYVGDSGFVPLTLYSSYL